MAQEQLILKKLDRMEKNIEEIKENMIPADAILSEDDRKAIAKAREEFKKGETISLEELKKELGE